MAGVIATGYRMRPKGGGERIRAGVPHPDYDFSVKKGRGRFFLLAGVRGPVPTGGREGRTSKEGMAGAISIPLGGAFGWSPKEKA